MHVQGLCCSLADDTDQHGKALSIESPALLKHLLFDWNFSALKCTGIWEGGGCGENVGLDLKRNLGGLLSRLRRLHVLCGMGLAGKDGRALLLGQGQEESGVTQLTDLQSRGHPYMG